MKKTKEKTKKSKSAKGGLFGGAAKSLKKIGKGSGLSTTQKVVGGAALVALGLGYLAKRRKAGAAPTEAEATPTTDAAAAEQNLAALDGNA